MFGEKKQKFTFFVVFFLEDVERRAEVVAASSGKL